MEFGIVCCEFYGNNNTHSFPNKLLQIALSRSTSSFHYYWEITEMKACISGLLHSRLDFNGPQHSGKTQDKISMDWEVIKHLTMQ